MRKGAADRGKKRAKEGTKSQWKGKRKEGRSLRVGPMGHLDVPTRKPSTTPIPKKTQGISYSAKAFLCVVSRNDRKGIRKKMSGGVR